MVLVSVVKASTPPLGRRNERYNYFQDDLESPRNFVPFHRNLSSDHQESLYWRNQHQFRTNESELMFQSPPGRSYSASPHQEINQRLSVRVQRHLGGEEIPEMPSHPLHQHSPTYQQSLTHTHEGKETKRWSFGGLFRRKEKVKSPSLPITIQFEPTPAIHSHDSDSSPESEPRQNFLRRLSKKKKKTSGDGTKAVEGFLKVPASVPGRENQLHRRSNPDFQSWETTKKCPPMLLSTNNNYSSSGSLSLSVEGSSSLSRGSRAAAKEAVKARAEARRESLLIESSSGGEAEDDLGQSNGHGSHSSLSLRGGNRKQKGRESRSPQIPPHHRVSNSSPNLNAGAGKVPPSPKWEARIIYTQETLHEDKPVVVRLPKRPPSRQNDLNGNPNYFETSADDHNVITAGLRLPLSSISSSYPKTGEPIYANLGKNQNQPSGSHTPPPLPRRDKQTNVSLTTSDFYRPVSCSYVDSYNNQGGSDQPDSSSLQPRVQNGHNYYEPQNQQFHRSRYLNERREDWRPQIKETILTYDAEPRRYLRSPSGMTNSSKLKRQEVKEERTIRGLASAHQPVIISKLGFPVRKLVEKSNGSQPVIHNSHGNGVSEFWSRMEESNPGLNPSSDFLNQQNSNLNRVRIRSADSSPLSLPKHAKNAGGVPLHGILHSNESISSLSSFSAETPSPNIFSKNKPSLLSVQNHSRSRRIKSPEFKISTPSQTSKEFEPRSACERLNVKGYSASPTPHKPLTHSHSTPPTQLMQNGKSPGKNLEDALNELEDMYKSLRLSDEDLLDRAERRDLPTAHQQLREMDPIPFTSRSFRFSPLGSGSLESLATTSGSGSTDTSRRQRARAPPLRRSGVPDRINDDMAKRKYDAKESPKATDPREVVGQSGSYLMFSPAFSPPVSPCPGEQSYSRNHRDPDLIQDDVMNVNFRRANSIRVIDEPQPLFGVPLGPITKAPPSDYLHATPVEKYRPLFRHVKNPDVVKDDQAFRNLRKDLNQENNLNRDWTPKLFSPLKSAATGSTDSVFNYNIQPEASSGKSKLRAVRSLSANISHLINPPCTSSALREEIGKWNSFTDLQAANRSARSLTPARGSSYLEPSWVEQANLEEYGTPLGTSPNTTIQKKFKLLKPKPPPPPQQLQDPNAPRRPWTDLIIQSYNEPEAEPVLGTKQDERAGLPVASPISEEDNDVFLDALPTTPSISPPKAEEVTPIPSFSENFGFLSGQKDRRGSYVDPRSSSLIPQPSDEAKRRSWSDMPKQYASFTSAYEAIKGAPKKIVFTPLPPPRRVRQISLEGFSTANENPSQSEQELNDLIDALVKEADTCGESEPVPAPSAPVPQEVPIQRKKRSMRQISAEKESKWQAAIAEIESSSASPHLTPEPKKRQQQIHQPTKAVEEPSQFVISVHELKEEELSQEQQQDERQPNQHRFQEPVQHSSSPDSHPQEKPQPQPRSILKKRPEENSSPRTKFRKVSKKSNCGVAIGKNGCIPSWNQRSQIQSTSLASSSPHLTSPPPPEIKNNDKSTYENDASQPVVIGRFSIGHLKNGSVSKLNNKFEPKDPKKCFPFPVPEIRGESDAQGMNGLRRLLNRECSVKLEGTSGLKTEDRDKSIGLKKSPSAGNAPSYWSRISSNQPSFLRRFFEKVQSNPTEKAIENPAPEEPIETGVEAEPESILGMNVAQKATHFMKLEHSQRFSKWKVTVTQTPEKPNEDQRPKSRGRYSTQPVTVEEMNVLKKSVQIQSHAKSSDKSKDDNGGAEVKLMGPNGENKVEPSKLSLRDRVHMFNRLSSCPMTIHVNPAAIGSNSFRHAGSTPPTSTWHSASRGCSSLLHQSKPSPQDIDSSYDNLTAFPLFRNHSTNDFPMDSNNADKSQSGIFQASISLPSSLQNNRIRSLFISNSRENEYQSEDGEVSSGGMEVAEIISKSYENSPLVRKKQWSTNTNPKSNLTRDAWKEYGALEDNISHWSTTTDLPELSQFQSKSSSFVKVNKVLTGTFPIKTSTSSLLPILTALSSSDDQLDDPPQPKKPIGTSKSRSLHSMANPSPPPRKKSTKKSEPCVNGYSNLAQFIQR